MSEEEVKYKLNEKYEGLGTYRGIEKYYPFNVDYYELYHKFVGELPIDGRTPAKVNRVVINRVKR